MGWSESTISDLRDPTLATGFTFQNVEENLLFVYVKEGVKVCCTYSKSRVKKRSCFLELSTYFLFGWREFKIWFIWVYLFQNLAKDIFKKWLEVNQSVRFVTISNILGPVYTERHVNAAMRIAILLWLKTVESLQNG